MTAPVLTGFAPFITFAENTVNAAPQLLDPAVVFTDAEGDFNGGTLSLSGLLAEDRVSVRNQGIGAGQIGLSGGNVTYAGLVIGTLTGGSGTTLSITFNAAATSVAIDKLIQNLTYANVSDTPTADRTLVLNVTDAAGQEMVRTIFEPLTGAANPLTGIDVGYSSTPSFVDLDGDGDFDLVVGDRDGSLTSFENTTPHGVPIVVTVTAQTDIITGTSGNDTLFGTAGPDAISGLAGNDRLYGGTGNDILQGNAGNDLLVGGVGNDSYFVDTQSDVIVEIAGNGTRDRVVTTVNYVLGAGANIEVMTTTNALGTEALNLTGNAFAQTIIGNAGANRLEDGLGAADTLIGGAGNDTYVVRTSSTQVFEGAAGGTADRVLVSTSFALAAGSAVEFLATTDAAGTSSIHLVGNALAQRITGNAGSNSLADGKGAADTLVGGAGSDTYYISTATTVIVEVAGAGFDSVATMVSFALAADDDIQQMKAFFSLPVPSINLTGNALVQWVEGNEGNNRLDGKGGSDTLLGFGGSDVFVFTAALGVTNIDEIMDYEVTDDRIDIDNAVFTGLATGALTAASFASNITGFATTAAQRIIYESDAGKLWFDADGNGAGARIEFANLDGGLAMTAGEFMVI